VSATLAVRSVNVGITRRIGTKRDQAVMSAIGKNPVRTPRIRIGWLNLDGDEQADRTVHGGADKTVYVYPPSARWAPAMKGNTRTDTLGSLAIRSK
jgi:MOSC domain-containing protein YiiM